MILKDYPGSLLMVRTRHKVPRLRNHENAVTGGIVRVPSVGQPLVFVGEGRYIQTSDVVSIDWLPDGFRVETMNSVYGVTLDVGTEALQELRRLSDAASTEDDQNEGEENPLAS